VNRTRIKICGVTRPQDAVAAARFGADAIGMIFHETSRRSISPDVARKIVSALPPFVTPVALFVDEDPQTVLDTAAALNIRTVQLHGDESPADVSEMRGLTVLKALHVDADTLSNTLAEWRVAIAEEDLLNLAAFVLDTKSDRPGGSGIENDWSAICELQSEGDFKGLPPIIVAGGLKPDNVAKVVSEIHPWAVDVSSGVESAIGQKAEEKIESFVNAVREADLRS